MLSTRTWRIPIGVALLSISTVICSAQQKPLPAIDDLNFEARSKHAFAVHGVISPTADGAIGFIVQSSADDELIVLFDPADGTPFLISDGSHVLVYDVIAQCLWSVDNARGYFKLEWDSDELKPLSIKFGALVGQDEVASTDSASAFQFGTFVATALNATDPSPLSTMSGTATVQRTKEDSETIRWNSSADAMTIDFTSRREGFHKPALFIHAQQPPSETTSKFVFPNVAKLSKDVLVKELKPETEEEINNFIGGGIWLPKIALAMGESGRDALVKGHEDVIDVNTLIEHDRTFGKQFRDALALQGWKFNNATTRPIE